MDLLADALAIDRIELRLLNALETGDRLPTGQVLTGPMPVAEVIRRAAAIPVPERRSYRAIRSGFPAAQGTPHGARSAAASASPSASRTSATPRASTTRVPHASSCRRTGALSSTVPPRRSGKASRA